MCVCSYLYVMYICMYVCMCIYVYVCVCGLVGRCGRICFDMQ